jgi:hypothetical protein
MFGRVRLVLASIAALLILSSSAFAQASITGVVRDTSGAVLPGVTVEASSPALIEKVRSVVSDGGGQYRIENLRPGAYVVTFTLPGFSTVRREGIELAGNFVATVNADLRVGALEETITVTGESPSVDVQSTLRQTVFDEELLEALPSSRAPQRVAALIPGVTTQRQDVGGIQGDGTGRGLVTVRGVSDARMNINGVSNQATSQSVTAADGAYNMAAYQEMAVDTGGTGAEYSQGGVRMNMIPRDGGNVFRGYFLASYASDSLQSDNLTDDLRSRGLSAPDKIKQLWDINPAFGGPVKRDKIWFHSTMRLTGAATYASLFYNKNAGNPNLWTYEPDTSREAAYNDHTIRNANVRVTWQATQKHKLAISVDPSRICDCPRGLVATTAPEAFMQNYVTNYPKVFLFGDWTAPLTNRLLVESAFVRHWSLTQRPEQNLHLGGAQNMISVLEQSNSLLYRASVMAHRTKNDTFFWRGAVSYITGAHSFKVGFNYGWGFQNRMDFAPDAPVQYRFNNGVPNQLTLHARPFTNITHIRDHGIYAQDRWTVGRLTTTLGLRYDYFHDFFPETPIGPSQYAPNRNLVFPKTDGVRWHDIEPRMGVAYDVFGDGTTAIKASLNKYMAGQAAIGIFAFDMAPSNRLINTTNRSWNDSFFGVGDPRSRNYVPDCDLVNPVANGECGAMSNPDFGSTRSGSTYDPDTLAGWGKRDHNWQFTTSLQREILPRTSVEVSYFRTWFGNFTVTDDRALSAADFDAFSITAPSDPLLPGGGGHTVSGLYDLKPASFGRRADLFLTYADNFGSQSDRWDGVDVSINARPRPGLLLQGGTNTQRRTTDRCEVVAKVPESAAGNPYCASKGDFITQVKLTGTYTVPRLDMQVTAALQSQPGPEIAANYTATNAIVAPSLGRNLSGGANNVSVNLIPPGTMYGERMNQLDLRVGKILQLGGVRTTASVDLYNALNVNPVLTESAAYATWRRPQGILNARFAKLVIQLDF